MSVLAFCSIFYQPSIAPKKKNRQGFALLFRALSVAVVLSKVSADNIIMSSTRFKKSIKPHPDQRLNHISYLLVHLPPLFVVIITVINTFHAFQTMVYSSLTNGSTEA